jgi:retron-type reverse transcriptase
LMAETADNLRFHHARSNQPKLRTHVSFIYQAGSWDRARKVDLHARVQRGAYRALPSRRTHIPKADGKQRPLAVAALEDKIVQRATVAVLNCIYEEEFLGFSYGFRPKRGQHDALDALVVGITTRRRPILGN